MYYINKGTEFLHSTAAASDTTGTGGLSDSIVIGIPIILLTLIVGVVVTVLVAWCTRKKSNEPSKCQLLTHSYVICA